MKDPGNQSLRPIPRVCERWLCGVFVAALVFSTYLFYAMGSGITITNDGSHFALFDALVTTGSPELRQVRQFAFGDSALYQGRYYSDRNPGLALLTATAYQGLAPLEPLFSPLVLDPKMAPRYNAGQVSRVPLVMLVPAFSGTLLMAGMYALCRRLGSTTGAAAAAAVSLACGTLLLRYSTLYYSHITAAALLCWGACFLFAYRQQRRPAQVVLAALLLSLAVLVEHLLLVATLPLAVYAMALLRPEVLRPRVIGGVVIAGATPMLALMTYNYVCFDSPFSLAHFHHSSDTANHNLATLFRWDRLGDVLGNLMFGAPQSEVGRQDLTGLFTASPFLLFLALPVFSIPSGKSGLRVEHGVLLAAFILVTVGAAAVWAPYGGWDRDYRYLLAGLPLLAPWLAASVDRMLPVVGNRPSWQQVVGAVVFLLLLAVAINFHFRHIRHALQVQYDTPLINLDAALVNVSLVYILTAVIGLAWFAVSGRLVRRH